MTQIKSFYIVFNDGTHAYEFALSFDDVIAGNFNIHYIYEVYQ